MSLRNHPVTSHPPEVASQLPQAGSEALRGVSQGSPHKWIVDPQVAGSSPVALATPETRFWAKVEKSDGCWFWKGAKNSQGYGSFRYGGKVGKAHRFSYELYRGPIPTGLEPDHLCRVRHCVNPWHLEWVTHLENCARKPAGVAVNRLTHCKRGHEFTEANSYLYGGKRRCHECRRICQRRRYWSA